MVDEKSVRVMVIEDDVQLRAVLAIFLRTLGIEVMAESPDGQDALDRLDDVHPDLILTDFQMPRLDGISLVRRLRERGDHTPIIMMSGQTDPQVQHAALAAGVNLYLAKPLSAGSLNLAITQAFGTAA